jgi:aminoglycoside 6'-N-acetyltransferase I
MQIPNSWKPLAVSELPEQFGSFNEWFLCGGVSVDVIVGRQIRPHADIDVGVFRSQLSECLQAIGKERVFLCQPPGTHVSWDGGAVDPGVHDIWISDVSREHWEMQILVFDDEGETVYYRRDRRVHWPKSSHAVNAGNVWVLNPLITFLYKFNRPAVEEKDIVDAVALIAGLPGKFPMLTSAGGGSAGLGRAVPSGQTASVREVQASDRAAWLAMRAALWPHCTSERHVTEMHEYFSCNGPMATFVAVDDGAELCGFAEVSLRPNAEGCTTASVGYLEGIYVRPDCRRRGVGRLLVEATRRWATSRGCVEFASDCHADNAMSIAFHRRLGFETASNLLHFRLRDSQQPANNRER